MDVCRGKSVSDIFVWRLKAKKHENSVRSRSLPDRVKRSPFMLHPPQQTHRGLACTSGKSCREKQRQKQPLIRAVTVIIITVVPNLMKTYLKIHPWNVYGKVSIPSVLLVVSLWKKCCWNKGQINSFFIWCICKVNNRQKKKKNKYTSDIAIQRWANHRENTSVCWRDFSGNLLF